MLVICGSTRQNSVNKSLSTHVARIGKERGLEVHFADLSDYPMPFYDADLEAKEGLPLSAQKLRNLMLQSDVIFIASPEYNGSISGVLKNTLDWSTRNESKEGTRDAFKNKKFVLMCATPGTKGTKGLGHLKDILTNLEGNVFSQVFIVTDAYTVFGVQHHPKLEKDLPLFVERAVSDSP